MARSINPYTQQSIKEYAELNLAQLDSRIDACSSAQKSWSSKALNERIQLVKGVSKRMLEVKQELAVLAATEMGKPITQGIQEVEKCAWAIDLMCAQAADILKAKVISAEAQESYVQHDPLGLVLGVMPWNYPYWQVIRYAIPALISGNGVLLKHASNVTGVALAIESLICQAVGNDLFSVLILKVSNVSKVIENFQVRAVTLTGSEAAGSAVAMAAGKAIKPVVLELGGSNAFVVMKDADVELAVKDAIVGRFQNSGQSCIAAKRILVHSSLEKEFTEKFAARVKRLWAGDPMDEHCYVGPMARVDLAEELHDQVERSMAAGAKLLVGGRYQGATYSPTVLTGVKPGMPAFDEETFGPVAAIGTFDSNEDMLALVNSSKYGLGVSLYSSDVQGIKTLASQFNEGAVFINSIVKSDPRLPFGGTKLSGFGRELGEVGFLNFVNQKTVYVG